MSVCIEQNKFENNIQKNHYAFFQQTPTCKHLPKASNYEGKGNSFVALLKLWIARSQQRKQLSRLDERLLEDIGLSRDEAFAEYSKSFWK